MKLPLLFSTEVLHSLSQRNLHGISRKQGFLAASLLLTSVSALSLVPWKELFTSGSEEEADIEVPPELPPLEPSKEDPTPHEEPPPSLMDRALSILKKPRELFEQKETDISPRKQEESEYQLEELKEVPTKVLPKGTRKSYPEVSRMGIFTLEEATTLVKLRQAKENLGVGKEMPPYIRDKIVQRALKYGLDPETMITYALIESGGNPNAVSPTGAIGVYQFTGGTANQYGVLNRFDPDQNIDAAMRLAKSNQRILASAGLPPSIVTSDLAVYISHQIGAGGAREVFRAYLQSANYPISRLSESTKKDISRNIGKDASTVAGYLEANRSSMESKRILAKKIITQVTPEVFKPPSSTPKKPPQSEQLGYAPPQAESSPVIGGSPLPQSVIRSRNGLLIASS